MVQRYEQFILFKAVLVTHLFILILLVTAFSYMCVYIYTFTFICKNYFII